MAQEDKKTESEIIEVALTDLAAKRLEEVQAAEERLNQLSSETTSHDSLAAQLEADRKELEAYVESLKQRESAVAVATKDVQTAAETLDKREALIVKREQAIAPMEAELTAQATQLKTIDTEQKAQTAKLNEFNQQLNDRAAALDEREKKLEAIKATLKEQAKS